METFPERESQKHLIYSFFCRGKAYHTLLPATRPSRCAVRGSLVASFRARSLPAIKKKKNSAGGNEKHPQGRKSP
ncbi:hypothetical protein [Selenomonas ruminantium]|uniref:hypothetical protein n=1 Tax=Selenomonas ruminantium TaxID=971 RepID=UPI00094CD43D|nr:hypothetical protein [Selenomonas ruminantium]